MRREGAFSVAYGLDFPALISMAPAFGLEPDQFFFEKLHAFETACLGIWTGTGCTPRQKEKCKFEFGEENMKWACGQCERKTHSA